MTDFNRIVAIPTGGGNPGAVGPTDSLTLTVGSITINGASFLRYYQTNLTGPQDGFNTVFHSSFKFIASGLAKESFYVNGMLMLQGPGNDYTVSESGGVGTGFDTITLAFAPLSNDRLCLDLSPS